MNWWKKRSAIGLAAVLAVVASASPVFAVSPGDPQSKSTNYRVDESTLGGTGDYSSASASFKNLGTNDGGSTLGDFAVGNSASTSFQSNSGSNTTNSPVLAFSIGSGNINFGTLTKTATATGTVTFNVKNYTSSGYVVSLVGNTPTNNGRSLAAMSTAGSSTAGTEQFGINLTANTAPITFGAAPVQVPGSTFGFGSAVAAYSVTNTYKYVSGQTIAQSTQSSGETDYTISYIANISALTPAGTYTAGQTIIATASY